VISIDVVRIELDGAAQPRNRLVPMPKPALNKGNRFDDVNIVRKTLLGLLEFCERPDEIALPVIAVITKSKMSLGEVWIQRESTIEASLAVASRAGLGSNPIQ